MQPPNNVFSREPPPYREDDSLNAASIELPSYNSIVNQLRDFERQYPEDHDFGHQDPEHQDPGHQDAEQQTENAVFGPPALPPKRPCRFMRVVHAIDEYHNGKRYWRAGFLAWAGFISVVIVDCYYANKPDSWYRESIINQWYSAGSRLFYAWFIILGFCVFVLNIYNTTTSKLITAGSPTRQMRTTLICGLVSALIFLVTIVVPMRGYRLFKAHVANSESGLELPLLCHQQGFETDVVLEVNSFSVAESDEAKPNVARFSSRGGMKMEMVLTPPIRPWGSVPDHLSFDLARNGTSESVLELLQDVLVRYTPGAGIYTFVNLGNGEDKWHMESRGKIVEAADDVLEFPDLDMPLASKGEKWRYSSDAEYSVPRVTLVDNDGETALKSVKVPQKLNCVEMRMCVKWGVEEMLKERASLEAVVVPVGRILVEQAERGLDCTKDGR
ncbi:hypothetical protein RUND412_010521 [Rhizina undulata]